MSEHLQFDDLFKKRLENHESEVPHDLFNRLMEERNTQQPEFDTIFKNKLKDTESAIPTDAFDKLMRKRDWQHSPIYSFFKRTFAQHEVPVPNGMFEHIMSVREANRPIAWWQRRDVRLSLLFLLVLTIAGVGFNLFKNGDNDLKLSENLAENANQMAKTNIIENTAITPSNAQNLPTTEGVDTRLNQNKAQNIGTKQNTYQEINQTYAAIAKTNSNVKKGTDNARYAGLENTDNFTQNQNSESRTLTRTTNSNSGIHPESSSLSQQKEVSAANEHTAADALSQHYYNPVNVLSPLDRLATEGVNFTTKNPCGDPGIGCPTFGRRVKFGSFEGKSWYIDAYASPEIALRTLKLKTVEGEALLRARDTTEKVLYGISAGTRASLVFDNGLAFRAGIVYAANNERFQKDSIAKQEILRIDRQTGELLGIDVIETTYRQTRYNKFKSIDFTLQVGYEVPINDFFTISMNGGANLNYQSAKRVRFQTAMGTLDSVIHSFGERSPAVFENKWGVSLVGSIAGYFQITPRIQALAEPHIRYYMRPLTRPDYSLSQRYTNIGLIIGLRYRL